MRNKIVLSAAAAALILAGPAYARSMATATSDLNIRSGPGPDFQVVGAMAANSDADLIGCQEGGNWCQVSYNGQDGWVYSRYLVTDGEQVVLVDRMQTAAIPEQRPTGAGLSVTAGLTGGAIAGAILGGPVGAAIGGAAGTALGATTADNQSPQQRIWSEFEAEQAMNQ